ncbi:MAG: hypothetical protein ACRDOS_01290 [Gaiellaceae bacterium]
MGQAWSKRLRNAGRIEALRRRGDASIQQVRVALERDERVRVPGDRLDELDVGAGGAASSRNAASTDGKSGTERTPDSVFGFRSCCRE